MDEMIQKVLANILSNITNTSLSESFIEMVLKRLVSFGYFLKEDDSWELSYFIANVESQIKNSCNTTSIPEGLSYAAVDMICGEFLMNRKNSGRIELSDLDLAGAITSISEGDVSVSFDTNSTDEVRFNQLINYLMNKGKGDFICFRKLKW